LPTLTNDIIEAAIEGLEAKKQRIDAQLAELRGMLHGTAATVIEPKAESTHSTQAKRKFSPEALKRMREAQQRRWAKARGEAEPAAETVPIAKAPTAKKAKRRMSAAGRKAIAEAQKKRWAAKKAAAKP
jgi:hypothetical protein